MGCFGVRVRAGGSKTYVVRYRPGAGGRTSPQRTVTIGRHGSPWTADTARSEARRILGLVETGADPAADHAVLRAEPTVAELAERFLAEHAEFKRKARTAAEYRRLCDKIILPAIGTRKVSSVARSDVARLHGKLGKISYEGNRTLAVLGKMFNLAERWGISCGRL